MDVQAFFASSTDYSARGGLTPDSWPLALLSFSHIARLK
jgi:hypothetical protein